MDSRKIEARVLELTKKIEDEIGLVAQEIFISHIRANSTDKIQENLKAADNKLRNILSLLFDLREVFYDD